MRSAGSIVAEAAVHREHFRLKHVIVNCLFLILCSLSSDWC